MIRKSLIGLTGALALALVLPLSAHAAESINADAVQAAPALDLGMSDAKRVVRDLLAASGQRQLYVGQATRKGDVYWIEVTTAEGIRAKTVKVDAHSGAIVS